MSSLPNSQPTVKKGWLLTACILASSMAFIDGSALNVALPALQAELGARGVDLLWILNGYLLMLASLILVTGSLGDKLGQKQVFMSGIGLFLFASVLCGLAPTTQFLIWARVLQGIGGALMVPGSLAMISSLLPSDEQGRAIGTWSAFSAVVTAAGPLLGGVLAELGLWRYVFLINVPLGGLALYALIFHVPITERDSSDTQIDYWGAILATLGLGAVTFGFISVPESVNGWMNPLVLSSLIIGCISLILFIVVEYYSKNPMLPLHLFRSHMFTGANIVTLLLYGAISLLSLFLSLNLVQVQGYTATAAGVAFVPFVIIMAVMSRWSGNLATRIGPRIPLVVGTALAGIGYFWISFSGLTETINEAFVAFLPGLIVFGVGMALTVAPLTTAVMTALPSNYAGIASGVNNATSRTAGVLGIAIVGALAISLFTDRVADATASLNLPIEAQLALAEGAKQLGDTTVPDSVPAEQRDEVNLLIKESFMYAYSVVMKICAVLCWLSSIAAWFLIGDTLKSDNVVEVGEHIAGSMHHH